MSTELGVSMGAVEKLISSLGYSKRCASWMPRMLTPEQKDHRVTVSQEFLKRYEAEGDAFLGQIVTGDETWCHYYEPESKRQSMELQHSHSPSTKKFRSQRSAGKVMCTVFWDAQSIIFLDFLEPGATANSEGYIKALTKLKARIAPTRSQKKRIFFLQRNNARPHASLKTTECVTKFDWTVLPHPP